MRACVICNSPIIGLYCEPIEWRKTCSSECAHKNRRLQEKRRHKQRRLLNPEKYRLKAKLKRRLKVARRRAALGKRVCRVCGADISYRRTNVKYCGMECRAARARELKPKIERVCRKCGEPILSPRWVHDQCLSPRKNYIKDAKTLDERLRRKKIVRRSLRKHKRLVRAAYQVFRELEGTYGKPQKPPPSTCIVCGITLTGWRRKMCGSKSCHAAREKISRQLIAEGKKSTSRKRWPTLATQPCIVCNITPTHSRIGICTKSAPCRREYQRERKQLIANGDWIGGCQRHPLPQPRQCIVCRNTLYIPKTQYCPSCKEIRDHKKDKRKNRNRTDRTRHEYAAYKAMRELNLLPKENRP